MKRWLMLLALVASAVCAHAQTLDGVTPARTGAGSGGGGATTSVCLLDMASPCVGGIN